MELVVKVIGAEEKRKHRESIARSDLINYFIFPLTPSREENLSNPTLFRDLIYFS